MPVPHEIATSSEAPWVRWTGTAHEVHAFIASTEPRVTLQVDPRQVAVDKARFANGTTCPAEVAGSEVVVTLPNDPSTRPPVPCRCRLT